MNGRQVRTLIGIVACVAIYTGATSAGKRFTSDSDMRRDYANSMNVNPDTLEPRDTDEAYFAAGVGNRDFVFATEPPDQTSCDALMAYLVADQTFLAELEARGFRNIGCARYQNGVSTWQTRAIVRKSPVKPAPLAAPSKNDARTSQSSA